MIAQAQDMELALESFAKEAADKVAQLWIERGNAPLTADQEFGLVDSIWEFTDFSQVNDGVDRGIALC